MFFGATSVVKNGDKEKYVYGAYGITFDSASSWSFDNDFFFYLHFLSQSFTNHGTAGEGGRHFFNSSLPLPPVSQTLRH